MRGFAVVLVAVTIASGFAMRPKPQGNGPAPGLPKAGHTSSECKLCHPGEHASWHRTFHRTMTQIATPETVLAPLERRGEEVWSAEGRIVMTTGSHHEQAYWVRDADGALRLSPNVWLIAEKTFVPRADAFLRPPGDPMPNVRWNSNCIQCHSTEGRPKEKDGRFETSASELGIACEACHGSGAAHVAKHADPIERWTSRADGKHDTSIVNPKTLDAERSAALCGQCHAYAYPKDEDEWWTNGYALSFRPGMMLDASRIVLSLDVLRSGAASTSTKDESIYWPDGTIRVGGREYNGLVKSPCFEHGAGDRKMTCLSCHSMHAGDPDDQLAPSFAKGSDAMCTQCHSGPDHSHHQKLACVECHMPMISYALFKAIRSHRIESPRIGSRLSACNLCHLDRTVAWAGEKLHAWYGQPIVVSGSKNEDDLPGVVSWALRGDAAERVLAAYAMGRTEALDASGSDWEKPVLDVLATADPYAAVRFVAKRSSRSVTATTTGRVLFDWNDDRIRTEIAHRDDRPVTIAE